MGRHLKYNVTCRRAQVVGIICVHTAMLLCRGEDQPLDSNVTASSKDMKECLITDIGELEALYLQQKLQVEQLCSELLENSVEGMSISAT